MISTVLPTPAPPNSPILKPFSNGAKKSITLMPVHSGSLSTLTSFRVTVGLLTETFFSLSNGSPSITFPYESNILPNILSEYSTSKPSDFFTTIAPFSNPLVLYKLRHVADILFISTTSKIYLEFPSISKISPIFIEVFDNIISIEISFIVIILPIFIIITYF